MYCCKRCQKYWICQDGRQDQNGLCEEGICCDLCKNYQECITTERTLEIKNIK